MGAAACRGRGFKERAGVNGERPSGAVSCRQQHNQASCQPAPPPSRGPAMPVGSEVQTPSTPPLNPSYAFEAGSPSQRATEKRGQPQGCIGTPPPPPPRGAQPMPSWCLLGGKCQAQWHL